MNLIELIKGLSTIQIKTSRPTSLIREREQKILFNENAEILMSLGGVCYIIKRVFMEPKTSTSCKCLCMYQLIFFLQKLDIAVFVQR